MPRRVLHDEFFKRAKAEGYLARSAYKLLEIQERWRVMRPGDRVLDLGCAPGAWVQVALEAVGPRGRIVGVDLQEVRHDFGPNMVTIQADAYATAPDSLTAAAGGLFNVLLSDMAPNTSGSADDLLSSRLCRRVLELAPALLMPGGGLVMKILEGSEYPAVLSEAKDLFTDARGFKPRASRAVSREMYIRAAGFMGLSAGNRGRPVADQNRRQARRPDRGGA